MKILLILACSMIGGCLTPRSLARLQGNSPSVLPFSSTPFMENVVLLCDGKLKSFDPQSGKIVCK